MTLYFAKAGAFVFGSGLAIVPFLHSGVVKEYGRLTERQFLDAVAVAMITPGPVVITVAFIGYLVSGLLGACLAAVGAIAGAAFALGRRAITDIAKKLPEPAIILLAGVIGIIIKAI